MSTETSQKPNVLIFGGLNTCARTFAALLVPEKGEALVSKLRIVDKFSVSPPTTYLGSEFKTVLTNPIVEYKQANLTVQAAVSSVFEPNEGDAPFSYVFDLTGEIRRDRPASVHIQQTTHVAKLLGQEAASRRVKAYVRLQLPHYETPEKGSHDEKEIIKPVDVQGVWWQEALRILAAIEELNLVILRIGFVYGPYIDYDRSKNFAVHYMLPPEDHLTVTKLLILGAVYAYEKQQMKVLWPPGKDIVNTVHGIDVAGALWACAEWMSGLGRKESNIIAGEVIMANDKSKVKDTEEVIPDHNQKLIAPLFNLVDDSNSTVLSIGSTITSIFGTTFGFLSLVTTTLAKYVGLPESVFEDMNESHVGSWTKMITQSNPPIPNTHLNAYMDEHLLKRTYLAYNADKIKRVVGYRLKRPEFNQENLQEIVDKWLEEGSWPIIDLQRSI